MRNSYRSIVFAVLMAANTIAALAQEVLPVTGSWINLFYQDVRNKYTNPKELYSGGDARFWRVKVREMHSLGIEYLVFMATANEGKAAYPSHLMPHSYAEGMTSPVDAIMDEADALGMKVFMSIGWAENQDDNLRVPRILQRQKEIMDELASLYGSRRSFYGWYLPVEDCLGPVLTDAAVVAVNSLVDKAHTLTPGKKTMISPYGFFCSDFDNPKFGKQIERLKVDIIAYQDEVGCVREDFPMPRLKENWKKIRAIHDRTGIELWANCELFTWEKGLNSRQSALIPAAMPRVVSQLAAASQAGVERVISFMVYGIWDDNSNMYNIGQPHWSKVAADDYKAWKSKDGRWPMLEASITGRLCNGYEANVRNNNTNSTSIDSSHQLLDRLTAEEDPNNPNWYKFASGYKEIIIENGSNIDEIVIRFLNCEKKGITFPSKVYFYAESEGKSQLVAIKELPAFPNTRHDAWIDCMQFRYSFGKVVKIGFECDSRFAIDEIYINPSILSE